MKFKVLLRKRGGVQARAAGAESGAGISNQPPTSQRAHARSHSFLRPSVNGVALMVACDESSTS